MIDERLGKRMKMRKCILCILLLVLSLPMMAQNYDLVVAKDGSGDFSTIQEAINAISDYHPGGRQRILVKRGVYEEKVVVPSYKTSISLIGEGAGKTKLVWQEQSDMRFQTYTLCVEGNGFECENMTMQNDAKAVYVVGDRTVFRNCRLLGSQETVFAGDENSRQVYYNCYIEGTGNFILGPATCWFDHCELHILSNGFITAASTPAHHPYGFVFYRCKVTADEKVKKAYLGYPWRSYAAVTFTECELPGVIAPEGWHNGDDSGKERTARFRENHCTGAGASLERRAPWTRKLTNEEISNLQVRRVLFQQGDIWDSNYRPVDFYALHFAFCDEYQDKGTPYVGGTLEPEIISKHPEEEIEPLVMRLNAVDCTTFVEYMSAAMLGRCDNPSPTDSILCRFVQALRYRGGKRGNYATRKHYFSDWIIDNEKQGLLKELTSEMPGAKAVRKKINFMTEHKHYYPQLAASKAFVNHFKKIEEYLSARETYYIPTNNIRKVLPELQDGDIVAFVTNKEGLDVSHVGFVWLRDSWHGEPHLLHASSKKKRVVVSQETLLEYTGSLPGCIGIRIMRLNLN